MKSYTTVLLSSSDVYVSQKLRCYYYKTEKVIKDIQILCYTKENLMQ